MSRRVLFPLLLALVTSCTWSNSLYLARRYSSAAIKSENDGKPFEAQSLWGQARTKADSAWQRSGNRKFEALGFLGIAKARMGQCVEAIPDLELAADKLEPGEWAGITHLELGRCRQTLGLEGVEEELTPFLLSPDRGRRLESARALASLYLDQSRWPALVDFAPGIEHPEVVFARGVALIALDRESEGRTLLAPLIATHDSTVPWGKLLQVMVQHRSDYAIPLLDSLLLSPLSAEPNRGIWFLGMVRGSLLIGDTLHATELLQRLGRYPATQALDEARRLNAEYRISRVSTPDELAQLLAALPETGGEDGGPNSRVLQLRRVAKAIVAERDSIVGVPQGDLRLFAQAEDARLILNAPRLAINLYQQFERDWPKSPYLVKAFVARMAIQPDSAEALRTRLWQQTGNPFLAVLLVNGDDRYLALDDSLGLFVRERQYRIFNSALAEVIKH